MKLDFTTHWLITLGGAYLLLICGWLLKWFEGRSERKKQS